MKRLSGTATSWRARLTGILATLAMSAGLLTATATPASAALPPRCNYDGMTFNACLWIEDAGNTWNVKVGFDRYMFEWYAYEILNYPGRGYFYAEMWGDDGGSGADDFLGSIPLVSGWPAVGANPAGLFAEFYRPGMNLNEDDGTDEVYAKVGYYDFHSRYWFAFRTGKHVGIF